MAQDTTKIDARTSNSCKKLDHVKKWPEFLKKADSSDVPSPKNSVPGIRSRFRVGSGYQTLVPGYLLAGTGYPPGSVIVQFLNFPANFHYFSKKLAQKKM